MRSSEPREGNSTKSSVGQSQLPEFSWVDNSLLEGSAQSMAECVGNGSSGDIAAAEREGCGSLLRFNEECVFGLVGTTQFPRSGHGNLN